MPTTPPAANAPAPGNPGFVPEHSKPNEVFGYADEAPFGDIVKDPTPVPTKATEDGRPDDPS